MAAAQVSAPISRPKRSRPEVGMERDTKDGLKFGGFLPERALARPPRPHPSSSGDPRDAAVVGTRGTERHQSGNISATQRSISL